MIVEQAGLEVDDHTYVLMVKLFDRDARLRKLVTIPREHVAAFADAGIARPEMKGRQRDIVSDVLIGELGESRLRIGRIGEAHRRVRVTQAPARPERHAPRQFSECAHDVADARSDEKIVVEFAVVDSLPAENVDRGLGNNANVGLGKRLDDFKELFRRQGQRTALGHCRCAFTS